MNNKIYTLKISIDKKTYRTIEIRGNKDLYDLAAIIVKSINFDFDHAFGFYNNIKNLFGSNEMYELFTDIPDCEPTEGAKGIYNVNISDVFTIDKKMAFLFDYGDNWIFLIECKNISEPIAKIKYPRTIEKVGKSPEQYPSYDDE